jgi:hypothetical protein
LILKRIAVALRHQDWPTVIVEFLLVLLGVLLALQLDNWNSQRKEAEELRNYLQNISNNVRRDRQEIRDIMVFREAVTANSAQIVEYARKGHVTYDEFRQLAFSEYNVFFDRYLEINQGGFDALKSSGYLGKIQNTRIEALINEYYLYASSIARQEKSLNDFIESMEVLGFENQTFHRMIDIVNHPDPERFVEDHQQEVRAILNSPSIFGANFRGSIESELVESYASLIALGEELESEANNYMLE